MRLKSTFKQNSGLYEFETKIVRHSTAKTLTAKLYKTNEKRNRILKTSFRVIFNIVLGVVWKQFVFLC